jgi:hypothetical protein
MHRKSFYKDLPDVYRDGFQSRLFWPFDPR